MTLNEDQGYSSSSCYHLSGQGNSFGIKQCSSVVRENGDIYKRPIEKLMLNVLSFFFAP